MPAPSIVQTQTTHRHGSGTLPTFTGSGASGSIAWLASRGVIAPTPTANGVPTTLTPSNESESVIITARDTADDATSTTVIEIQATFPYQPNWDGADSDLDDKTNVSLAEDLTPSFVVKSELQDVFRYAFNRREVDPEYLAARAFYEWHKKARWFWIKDCPRSILTDPPLIKVRFDSAFSQSPVFLGRISYSCVMREAIDA